MLQLCLPVNFRSGGVPGGPNSPSRPHLPKAHIKKPHKQSGLFHPFISLPLSHRFHTITTTSFGIMVIPLFLTAPYAPYNEVNSDFELSTLMPTEVVPTECYVCIPTVERGSTTLD
jgi:hypothetical protein